MIENWLSSSSAHSVSGFVETHQDVDHNHNNDLSEAKVEIPTFEGPSIANLSRDFKDKIIINHSDRRQKTLEGCYSSDRESSIIDDSVEANQLRIHLRLYRKLPPFEQFQKIRNHNYAFNLLRHQRGDRICQELNSFLKTVQTNYPYGVRHSTLENAIEPNDRTKFENINFSVLEKAFSLLELSQLPGTSPEYETGGMWVRGDIYAYDEKKYKGLERLHYWQRAEWMVPKRGSDQMENRLKNHMENVFSKWNFSQKSANHQDQISFCVNWYFRQIVAQLVHLHDVFHSEENQDPINRHSLRRYAEENVYSLSETMTENIDSCAALFHMETISDSIANHQMFYEVFQFYNIQRTDLTDHYQMCKKIVNHKIYRQEFRVTPYYSEINPTIEDFVEFTDDFMRQKIKNSPKSLFEMAKEDALTYEDSVNWNKNSLQIFHQNRRPSDGFFRDKGLVSYVSACNEVSVQVHQDTLKDIGAEFKKYHSTFIPEAVNAKVAKYNSRTAFYGCFPYSLAGREHLIRRGLMVAAWVNEVNDQGESTGNGEWNRAIVTEVIDCPDSLFSRMTQKKTKINPNQETSFYSGELKIHLIDWGYEMKSNASEIFLLPNSESFLLCALAIRCYVGPLAGYRDVRIKQTCDYTKCKLYTKTTENLGSHERFVRFRIEPHPTEDIPSKCTELTYIWMYKDKHSKQQKQDSYKLKSNHSEYYYNKRYEYYTTKYKCSQFQ